ncbi:carbohydrate kinase family protein [Streptomyces aculeolatus]
MPQTTVLAGPPYHLVIGEVVADIVRSATGADRVHPGGSPANVACGLARLGWPTALLTQIGRDRSGELLSAHLRSAGVRLLSDGHPVDRTPSAVVRLDPHGRADYDFDIAWTLRDVPGVPASIRPTHVHVGSIAAVTRPGAAAVAAYVARMRPQATVSYDPNVRPALMGPYEEAVARVEHLVSLSDVVKVSDEDLGWLYPGSPVEHVVKRWLALGVSLLLVTRGANGSTAWSAQAEAVVPAPAARVVDTVGAGDAYMAAMLDALGRLGRLGADRRAALARLDEDTLARMASHAATAAALTVSRAGAALPDRSELPALPVRRAVRNGPVT